MDFYIDNYKKIKDFIANIAANPNSTKIIAVTKTKPYTVVEKAISQGVNIFGENRVIEAYEKFHLLKNKYKNIELHMIGTLQTNKVSKALSIFNFFHTLDRESLAKEFVREKNINQTLTKNFFVQVNLGAEEQKSGIDAKLADEFISHCKNDLKIPVCGLMCIPPIEENPIPFFKDLKKIAIKNNLNQLSMGMSNDYKSAIKDGSTYIRIGTLLFGER